MDTDKLYKAAENLGREAGEAAASWYFDGNTTDETYHAVLRGIEDGDPRVLDSFPPCDLSGQWADEPSGPDVYGAIYDEAGVTEDEDNPRDDFSDLLDAYEMAYDSAVQDEIERMAREQVTP